MTRLTITDIAIDRGLTYKRALDLALKGECGQVVREGRHLFVMVPESSDDNAE